MSNFKNRLKIIKDENGYRERISLYSAQDTIVRVEGKSVTNFASNNYLSLANNKSLKGSFKNFIEKYGIGSGSSPLISGYNKEYKKLELYISKLLGFESTLITNSGYLANVGLLNAISERETTVFQDRLNHNSIIESSRLSRTNLIRYKHLDYEDLLSKITKAKSATKIIYTDSVFSMTGEKADIVALSNIAKKTKSLLFVDDAHGFGVLRLDKKRFPSCVSNINLKKVKIDAYIATFGKAIGTHGAFISGSKDIIELLIQKSKPYIYSTALPPAIIATTLESIKMIKRDLSLITNLTNNIRYFQEYSFKKKLKVNVSDTAIQTLKIGNPKSVINICKKAMKQGIFIQGIRYPTVPKDNDLIRINLCSGHTKKQIQSLIEFLIKIQE